ncbi:erythroblast NAD(P)(+)--arginine ADP-ribosyltransferase-like isoform X2 [Hemicordylus capensis]|uniref:erythroblast NAD(P)(+)--arginine ADP-ribosyltransferase-like isoform X2 n=1 Tax=Hemicordylus capensis TaxID=884348 RepID=UPI00230474C8|nr:erythroblast NAD(P)(+)--arginine ADP-ribosyltransferase-like isoform X2 [Hemicordylus capensis]
MLKIQEWMIKMPPLPMLLVLYLMGTFTGHLQVFCFPIQRRDLFPTKQAVLDMALTSFDDQYKGCASQMEEELQEINRTEFASNRVYAEAWEQAASRWNERKASLSLPRDLKPEYAIAIMAYTIQGRFHRDFNAAVREAGRTRDYYLRHFHFKTFHFLLTRALQALDAIADPRCLRVYRGVRGVRFASERLKSIRFGQFTSSSLQNESALQFGKDTFFTMETCHGVDIKNFSFFPGEEEVLIPPFEKFKVTNFTKAPETTFIQLHSLQESSVYNCVFVQEKRCKTRRCNYSSDATPSQLSANVPVLFLLWGFLLIAGAFGSPGFL